MLSSLLFQEEEQDPSGPAHMNKEDRAVENGYDL
jgi:hypothetical protein